MHVHPMNALPKTELCLEINGRQYRADAGSVCDISISLQFNASQLQAFGAPAAQSEVYRVSGFVGDVAQGGSCNCQRYHFTAHCNGTHTESVGHITREPIAVNTLATSALMLAHLITVEPQANDNLDHATNRVISRATLQRQLAGIDLQHTSALLVRTLPNTAGKLTRNYDVGSSPAYFEPEALAWLASVGIEHLLVDVPSVDRMDDGGHLLAHRAFWGLPVGSTDASEATRPRATITELVYVPDHMPDAHYLLSLQLAPFVSDATPSRPLLYPLT